MPAEPDSELLSTWFGDFVVEHGQVIRERRFPAEEAALQERLRARREGRLAPEEDPLEWAGPTERLRSRDRRFERLGVSWTQARPDRPRIPGPSWESLRSLLISEAEEALRSSWDPSIHLDEAVRALADVDRTRNLLGERLAGWATRDRPEIAEEEAESGELAMRSVLEPAPDAASRGLPAGDPALIEGRRRLAEEYRSLGELRRALESAIDEAAQRRMPNLSSLLGPTLSARMVSQAGGLDRLARLPASTVQVLGAEKAFFDHLRRGSRPPRHGLLFLHPSIQGAPRRTRGRLARALAGKVAIAARLDQAGRPVNATLLETFRHRAETLGRAPRKAPP